MKRMIFFFFTMIALTACKTHEYHYYDAPGYPAQPGYQTSPGYPSQGGYQASPGYSAQPGYQVR